jgi:streptogramin lyase
MGLGHGEIIQDITAGMAIGARKPAQINNGGSWSAQAFRRYFNQASRQKTGDVIDYQIRTDSDEAGVYDTHEIHASRNGLIYFTQQKHDRAGYIRPDGAIKLFEMPEGSHPHGIRLDQNNRLFITLEYQDKLAEIDPINGTILREFDISFDDPSNEGVVGPHGLAIDTEGKLWYTGKSSDVIGWVNPANGEQQKFILPTRANFGANFSHGILSNASGPIHVEIDQSGNAWFVNLLTSEIGRISGDGSIKFFEISGLASVDNTRPINVIPGPDGKIWVTVEGNNDASIPSDSLASKGGIARFDPITETFIGYQQSTSKGAGGAVGATKDSIWFQYQEQSLEELTIDQNGRQFQTSFALPEIGQRVMHRITRGPEGNMWFTSLMQDTVSVLTTDNAGIPVYSFREEKGKLQYLSALPDEITGLQQDQSGYSKQEGLFLSALKGRHSVPTHRYKDNLTGRHLWTIDRRDTETELFAFKENSRYSYEGRDFRVYPNRDSADGLIPIYQAFNPRTHSIEWSDTRKDFSKGFQDVRIAWYAEPFPIDASQF